MPGKGKGPIKSPPGWGKGKKTGWQGAEVPPGLGRKARSRPSDEQEVTPPQELESELPAQDTSS